MSLNAGKLYCWPILWCSFCPSKLNKNMNLAKKKKEKLYQRVTYVAIISQADMSVSGITKGRKEKSQRSRLLIGTKTNNDEELCCYT